MRAEHAHEGDREAAAETVYTLRARTNIIMNAVTVIRLQMITVLLSGLS